mmetsp:Transcript_38207/g.62015  ORF Transcript_38207/g.62015 Transcript_38207/m.62015 type:complete len:205 (+) Transcript_38207:533-1147(+)
MDTAFWLSWYVENTCDFLVGIAEFRLIKVVITPPTVSIPRLNGVTSMSTGLPPAILHPLKVAPRTLAPYATASSALTPLLGSFPLKYSLRSCCTFGIRVEPPTSTTSSISPFFIRPSASTFRTGIRVFLNRSALSSSNLARVNISLISNPLCKLSISTLAWVWDDNARFTRSTSRRSFCNALWSFEISLLCLFLKALIIYFITR